MVYTIEWNLCAINQAPVSRGLYNVPNRPRYSRCYYNHTSALSWKRLVLWKPFQFLNCYAVSKKIWFQITVLTLHWSNSPIKFRTLISQRKLVGSTTTIPHSIVTQTLFENRINRNFSSFCFFSFFFLRNQFGYLLIYNRRLKFMFLLCRSNKRVNYSPFKTPRVKLRFREASTESSCLFRMAVKMKLFVLHCSPSTFTT